MWRFVSVGRKSQLQAEFLATPRWSRKFEMLTQAAGQVTHDPAAGNGGRVPPRER